MFELPGAKRVKRSELFSPSSSEDEVDHTQSKSESSKPNKVTDASDLTSNDRNDFQDTKVDYGFEYEFVDKARSQTSSQSKTNPGQPTTNQPSTTENPESEEQTYAFNLFAPKPKPIANPTEPSSSTTTTITPFPPQAQSTRITIRSPTPPSHLPASLQSSSILIPRAQSDYFTSALPATKLCTLKSQYQDTAISGSAIISLSQTAWPGTHLPWRIIAVPKEKLTLLDPSSKPDEAQTLGNRGQRRERTRPSKKRRILARQRIAAREALKVASVRTDEAEREKRTRRNREKKVKRKMKEKAKKAAVTEAATDVVNGGGRGEIDQSSSSTIALADVHESN